MTLAFISLINYISNTTYLLIIPISTHRWTEKQEGCGNNKRRETWESGRCDIDHMWRVSASQRNHPGYTWYGKFRLHMTLLVTGTRSLADVETSASISFDRIHFVTLSLLSPYHNHNRWSDIRWYIYLSFLFCLLTCKSSYYGWLSDGMLGN